VTVGFREALARISAPDGLVEPETLDFPAEEVRFVRVSIHATDGGAQPCIDELEPGLYRVHEDLGWPSYVAKASLGVVLVAEDGSASFLAPAGKVLYFELLDAEFDELQRMRSVIQLQPGEQRSCIGCHEDRRRPPPRSSPRALAKAPSRKYLSAASPPRGSSRWKPQST